MNILKLFTAHKVVEINLSTGLRTGHMLAQHVYNDSVNSYIDNGNFFRMSKANPDEVVLANSQNAVGPYYLHYTEELETTGLVTALKYFTDEIIDNKCYPRCIALYTGDTFTTNNYTLLEGGATLATAKFGLVGNNGLVELYASIPQTITGGYNGPLFQVVASTLPDGTAAAQLTVMDCDYNIAATQG